jgi:hypothetical protein
LPAFACRRGLTFLLDEKSKQKNQENFNSLTTQTENFQKVHPLLFMPVVFTPNGKSYPARLALTGEDGGHSRFNLILLKPAVPE